MTRKTERYGGGFIARARARAKGRNTSGHQAVLRANISETRQQTSVIPAVQAALSPVPHENLPSVCEEHTSESPNYFSIFRLLLHFDKASRAHRRAAAGGGVTLPAMKTY